MAGGMTFWDMNKKKKIGTTESDCTVTSAWSPDGRWFMTATTRPRLQTDNGIRLFTYNGSGPVHTEKFDSLYEATWRPAASGVYPDRPQSPGAVGPDGPPSRASAGAGAGGASAAPKSVGVYRPRHSTGLVSAMMSADRVTSGPRKLVGKGTTGAHASAVRPAAGLPVGAPPPSSTKSANQRRREKQKQKAEEAAKAAAALEALSKAGGDKAGGAASSDIAEPAAPSSSSSMVSGVDVDALSKEDISRKIKATQKKLKQIATLKTRRDTGESLDESQLAKISGEPDLVQLVEALEARQ